jgi:hypothetical protein
MNSVTAGVFVPVKPFQSNEMLVGKDRRLPWSGASEKCFTRVSSSLAKKHLNRLKRLAANKNASLLQAFVNYDRKKLGQILS